MTDAPNRHQKRITDLSGDVERLYDRVYEEYVEVVEVHTGAVDLRYPHQEERRFFKCDCRDVVEGMGGLEEHAEVCDDADEEWFDLVMDDPYEATERNEWFEEYDHPGNLDCVSYSWPLDGHRFKVCGSGD